jgi:hypothetical protein
VALVPRLRQVALVARELTPVANRLQEALALDDPYHDPGIIEFGLENSVFAVGDTFLEIVSPVQPGTTAGRYLDRRGGDSGYMAIFQVPDIGEARRRIDSVGVRVVWQADLPGISGTHLHPKDVPGAIVSIDWADPPGSWQWAGPSWTGGQPPHPDGGITGLTVEVGQPAGAAERWATVLGVAHEDATIVLDEGRQTIRFVPRRAGQVDGITQVTVASSIGADFEVAGVRFITVPVSAKERA